MMQKFWDSSLHLANVDDDCDTHRLCLFTTVSSSAKDLLVSNLKQ